MQAKLFSLFTSHPASVGETYWKHLQTASFFAWTLSKAAIAAFIHALVPGLFEKTASQMIALLYQRMVVARSNHAQESKGSVANHAA